MNDLIADLIHDLFESAREYLRETPSRLDDYFIRVLDVVEAWLVAHVITRAAAKMSARLAARGMALPPG